MADKTIPVLKVLRGSVGIGTNTPEHVLDIQSGTPTLCVRSVSGSGNANVHIGEPNTTAYGLQLRWEGNLGNVFFDNRYNHATRPHMYFRMRVAGTPITAMTIDPAGNVGIGTTAPARKLLHVSWNGNDVLKIQGSFDCTPLGCILKVRALQKNLYDWSIHRAV